MWGLRKSQRSAHVNTEPIKENTHVYPKILETTAQGVFRGNRRRES